MIMTMRRMCVKISEAFNKLFCAELDPFTEIQNYVTHSYYYNHAQKNVKLRITHTMFMTFGRLDWKIH